MDFGVWVILDGSCHRYYFPEATNFAAVNFLPPEKKGLGMGVYTIFPAYSAAQVLLYLEPC